MCNVLKNKKYSKQKKINKIVEFKYDEWWHDTLRMFNVYKALNRWIKIINSNNWKIKDIVTFLFFETFQRLSKVTWQ